MAGTVETVLIPSVIPLRISALEIDSTQLGEQLRCCLRSNGRLFAIRCHLESLHRHIVRRTLSSLMMATLVIYVLGLIG